MKFRVWIEAVRLRTLPVSAAGVIVGVTLSALAAPVAWAPAWLCLAFALLAQTASNFANEYFDWRKGLDRPGREGPRRGVTEGDISPRAMFAATLVTLSIASCCGLALLLWGGWLLLPVGIATVAGVLAYSAGPWPLSHHALGEAAVVLFFGVVPVNMTFYIQTGTFGLTVLMMSLAIGLMGANILIVNNYRDIEDDIAVGKHTLASIIGRRASSALYLFNSYAAVALTLPLMWAMPAWVWIAPGLYLLIATMLWSALCRRRGAALNPLLGMTAMAMLLYALAFAAETSIYLHQYLATT